MTSAAMSSTLTSISPHSEGKGIFWSLEKTSTHEQVALPMTIPDQQLSFKRASTIDPDGFSLCPPLNQFKGLIDR